MSIERVGNRVRRNDLTGVVKFDCYNLAVRGGLFGVFGV
jgi:hypothetical protein